jgi:hypothetical protein
VALSILLESLIQKSTVPDDIVPEDREIMLNVLIELDFSTGSSQLIRKY